MTDTPDNTNEPKREDNVVRLSDFAESEHIRFVEIQDQEPSILRLCGPFRNAVFKAAKDFRGSFIIVVDQEVTDSAASIWHE